MVLELQKIVVGCGVVGCMCCKALIFNVLI